MSLIVAAAITAGAALTQAAVNLYAHSKTNASNKVMQKEQFDYQKYLNANQYRIQTADMQAAGINPAMGNMNSLQSGSYQSQSAPQIDLSAISQLAATNLQAETSKQINDDSIASSEKIAEMNISSSAERNSAQLKSQQEIAAAQLAETTRSNKAKEQIEALKDKHNYETVKKSHNASVDAYISDRRTNFEQNIDKIVDSYKAYKNGRSSVSASSFVGSLLDFGDTAIDRLGNLFGSSDSEKEYVDAVRKVFEEELKKYKTDNYWYD